MVHTKGEILSEIRRCTIQLGGSAPGYVRFAKLTGIKRHEWLGRYWVKWSDAVREAGCNPSQYSRKRDDEPLLSGLVDYIRSLGRFPSQAEMLVHGRADNSFPTRMELVRLGPTKKVLAQRIAEYCETRGDLDAVRDLCLNIAKSSIAPADALKRTPDQISGFVYLFKVGRYYKIGRTNSLGRRMREFEIQLPERGRQVHAIKTDDPAGIERYWHERFAPRRVRSDAEWFDLRDEDVRTFKLRSFM